MLIEYFGGPRDGHSVEVDCVVRLALAGDWRLLAIGEGARTDIDEAKGLGYRSHGASGEVPGLHWVYILPPMPDPATIHSGKRTR